MPALVVAAAGIAAGYAAVGFAVAEGLVVAGGVGAAIIGGVTSTATQAVLGNAIGSGEQQQQMAAAASPTAQLSRGILANTASTIDPIPVVYGSRRIGGTRALTATSGNSDSAAQYLIENPDVAAAGVDPWQHYQNYGKSEGRTWPTPNQFLNLVISLCEGEISAINTVYLDGVATTDSKFSGLVWVEKHLGADAQTASAALIAECPNDWSATDKGCGVAYVWVKLKFDPAVFHSVPVITADVDGRLLYDDRSATTYFCDNVSMEIRDYMTNTRYGRGLSSARLDLTSFMAAANTCDITYLDTVGATRKQHTGNGVIDTNANSLDNIRNLLTACRGTLLFSARGYGLLIDKAETPTTFEFNEDNICGSWSIGSGSKKRAKFNRVRGNWFNPNTSWQPGVYPADSTTFRTEDNGILLESQLALPFTTNQFEAQMKTEQHMRQSRFGKTLGFRATIAGMECEVGDVVPVTHSTPRYVSKPFRVVRIGLLSSDEVNVEMIEYDGSVYTPNPLTAPRTTPTTNLPNPDAMPALTGLALTSGTDDLLVSSSGTIIPRIHVTWTTPQNVFATQVEVQYKKSTAGSWTQNELVKMPHTESYIAQIEDGENYDVRARFVGIRGGIGTWGEVLNHLALGKTEAPSTVGIVTATLERGGYRVSFPAVTDPDLDAYEVRVDGSSWDTATLVELTKNLNSLIAKSVLASSAASVTRRVRVRAKDTSGIYSAADSYVDIVETRPANVSQLSITGSMLSFIENTDIELEGYILKFHYGSNFDWGTAVSPQTGLILSSPYDLITRPSGVVTLMLKAVDIVGNESSLSTNVVANLGDAPIANVVETVTFDPTFDGTLTGCTVVSGELVADSLDSLYGTDDQSFYGADTDPFYEASAYAQMIYVTDEVAISTALAGSIATLNMTALGTDLGVWYRFADPASFYGTDADSFYGADADPVYGLPGDWLLWPGQIVAMKDVYQFKVQIGAGAVQGVVSALSIIIDAPDITEDIDDLAISAAGTALPYIKSFVSIKNIIGQLQANISGAITIEVDKASPLVPTVKAYNAAHTAVSGATADFTLKGY